MSGRARIQTLGLQSLWGMARWSGSSWVEHFRKCGGWHEDVKEGMETLGVGARNMGIRSQGLRMGTAQCLFKGAV